MGHVHHHFKLHMVCSWAPVTLLAPGRGITTCITRCVHKTSQKLTADAHFQESPTLATPCTSVLRALRIAWRRHGLVANSYGAVATFRFDDSLGGYLVGWSHRGLFSQRHDARCDDPHSVGSLGGNAPLLGAVFFLKRIESPHPLIAGLKGKLIVSVQLPGFPAATPRLWLRLRVLPRSAALRRSVVRTVGYPDQGTSMSRDWSVEGRRLHHSRCVTRAPVSWPVPISWLLIAWTPMP